MAEVIKGGIVIPFSQFRFMITKVKIIHRTGSCCVDTIKILVKDRQQWLRPHADLGVRFL